MPSIGLLSFLLHWGISHSAELGDAQPIVVSDPSLQALHWKIQGLPASPDIGVSVRLGSVLEYHDRGLTYPPALRDASARLVRTRDNHQVVEVAWRRPPTPQDLPVLLVVRTEGALSTKLAYVTSGPASETPLPSPPSVGEILASLPTVTAIAAPPAASPHLTPSTNQVVATGPSDPPAQMAKADVPVAATANPTEVASPSTAPIAKTDASNAPLPGSFIEPAQPSLAGNVPVAPIALSNPPFVELPLEVPHTPPLSPDARTPGTLQQPPNTTSPSLPTHRANAAQTPRSRHRLDHLRLGNTSLSAHDADSAVAAVQMSTALGDLQSRLNDLEAIAGLMKKIVALQERQIASLNAQIGQVRALRQAPRSLEPAQQTPLSTEVDDSNDARRGLLTHLAVGAGLALIVLVVLGALAALQSKRDRVT